jgi:peptidoglycan hydrolase CwlO-like protein
MKRLPALIAAFIITGILGFAMFTIGANAMTNKNTVPTLNQPGGSSTTSTSTNSAQNTSQAQLQQYQSLISQYQARDKQYQGQVNTLIQQVNQANSTIQEYQQLLMELQRRGVIFITQDGQILIPGG